MKKEEIYVAVSGKEQAMQFKAILEGLGEGINDDYWVDNDMYIQTKLVFDNNEWIISDTNRTQITIKQLIELLVKEDNRKPVLKSEDGVDLYEGDEIYEALIHPLANSVWHVNTTIWKAGSIGARWVQTPNNSKAFSTKQAALDFVEKMNKPKEIELELFSHSLSATVQKDGILIKNNNIAVALLGTSDIEDIANALKQLQ